MGEFSGWRAWLLQHLPWYDAPTSESRHQRDADLRRQTDVKFDKLLEDYRRADKTVRNHR